MNTEPTVFSRRHFVKSALVGAAAASLPLSLTAAANNSTPGEFCAFEKPLTFLKHHEMPAFLAEAGYNGVEAAVRPKGRVEPERVEEDLPKMVEACRKHGIAVTILTSGINSIDQPHTEKVLRTAAKLGIKRYRLLWYRYDEKKPILPQVEGLRPVVRDLAQMNRQIGISGMYQNHAGPYMVGASLWDIYSIIKDLDPRDLGLAYDLRHSQVEAGTCWPTQFSLVQSHITAVCAKDFTWNKTGAPGTALGAGRVDRKVMKMLAGAKFVGPYSVHVEYLPGNVGRQECAQAFKQDLVTMKSWIKEAYAV